VAKLPPPEIRCPRCGIWSHNPERCANCHAPRKAESREGVSRKVPIAGVYSPVVQSEAPAARNRPKTEKREGVLKTRKRRNG
jgi:hypothetical protein